MILRRICQLSLTRITHQVSRAFDLNLTGVLSYGFALESARECGRMIIIGMAFGAIPDFIPFLGKSLETLVAKLLSMTNE